MANAKIAGTDWRGIALALLMGALGGSSVPMLAPPVVRPDPFRGTQAAALEARLEGKIAHELDRLRLQMRVELPPFATRRRIIALEEQMRITAPSFRPPSALWHDE
jgi:hypothetical protein